jgi:ferritin-like metal-binding protein YciE
LGFKEDSNETESREASLCQRTEGTRSIEKDLVKALTKIPNASTSEVSDRPLGVDLGQTKEHVVRLEKIFKAGQEIITNELKITPSK